MTQAYFIALKLQSKKSLGINIQFQLKYQKQEPTEGFRQIRYDNRKVTSKNLPYAFLSSIPD